LLRMSVPRFHPHLSRTRSSSFFFHDPATTHLYTLSLHDALPISQAVASLHDLPHAIPNVRIEYAQRTAHVPVGFWRTVGHSQNPDRKSTRLNSSHGSISYAVFCLKKKKQTS